MEKESLKTETEVLSLKSWEKSQRFPPLMVLQFARGRGRVFWYRHGQILFAYPRRRRKYTVHVSGRKEKREPLKRAGWSNFVMMNSRRLSYLRHRNFERRGMTAVIFQRERRGRTSGFSFHTHHPLPLLPLRRCATFRRHKFFKGWSQQFFNKVGEGGPPFSNIARQLLSLCGKSWRFRLYHDDIKKANFEWP